MNTSVASPFLPLFPSAPTPPLPFRLARRPAPGRPMPSPAPCRQILKPWNNRPLSYLKPHFSRPRLPRKTAPGRETRPVLGDPQSLFPLRSPSPGRRRRDPMSLKVDFDVNFLRHFSHIRPDAIGPFCLYLLKKSCRENSCPGRNNLYFQRLIAMAKKPAAEPGASRCLFQGAWH